VTRRTSRPLGQGEYGEAGYARERLLETVKRVYPEFLDKLAVDVFPLFKRMADAGFHFADVLDGRDSPYHELAQEGGLKAALSNWATTFNARPLWLLDGALRTLRVWYLAPDWLQSRRWVTYRASLSDCPVVEEDFQFEFFGWDPQLFRWEEYRRLLLDRFERALSIYEKQARRLALCSGLVRVPRKYSPENFEWFVLYQFAGMSSNKIVERWAAKDQHVEASAVLKGIKAAAKLIGWDLRKATPSRNRKIR
jgi:hypothetical protein